MRAEMGPALLAALFAYGASRPAFAAEPILGMARRTEIRIASELSGRLAAILVRPGERVRKGAPLASLDAPELAASVAEAAAAAAKAAADRADVYSGVRAEQVAIQSEAVEAARANVTLAEQELARATALAEKGFASKQRLDEATASFAKTIADRDAKSAELAAAKAGPTAEERALADVKVAQAEAAAATLKARLAKTEIRAPVDGVARRTVAEPGEALSPGEPILTLEADGPPWFAFTVREDHLVGLMPGASVRLTSVGGGDVEGRVMTLRPLGEFATWRAARAVGDHDLNSFEMRIDGLGEIDGVEPGMAFRIGSVKPQGQ